MIRLFILALVLTSATCKLYDIMQYSHGLRIVGGMPIDIKDAPYQMRILYIGKHLCGGSLIKPDTVITAAHCFINIPSTTMILIKAGTSGFFGGVYRRVESLKVHECYDSKKVDFDVAIIKLKMPFFLSNKIKTIPMVCSDEVINKNQCGFISGWGYLSGSGRLAKKLQGTYVPIIDREECKKHFCEGKITNNMICAGLEKGGVDACQGDSGGPLVINGKLSGIVSFGYGCAEPKQPGIYTSVAALRDWIDQNI